MPAHIIIATDTNKYKGDFANATVVGNTISDMVSGNITRLDDGAVNDQLEVLIDETGSEYDVTYLVTAGEAHIDLIAELPQKNNIVRVLSGHQLSEKINAVAGEFNFVGLPGHALSPDQKAALQARTNLIETLGVPHMVTRDTLEQAYKARLVTDRRIQDFDMRKTDLLVLAGDAPDASGQMHYFTAGEAIQMTRNIISMRKPSDNFLAVTNGPRTGKFDPMTGGETQSHRGNTSLDPVTKAVQTELKKAGYIEGYDFGIWDFRFLETGVDSAYQALLYAAIKTSGDILMPGESTSMITEVADNLGETQKFVVYTNGAMSSAHNRHVESVHKAGIAHVLSGEELTLASPHNPKFRTISDAQRIARHVLRR